MDNLFIKIFIFNLLFSGMWFLLLLIPIIKIKKAIYTTKEYQKTLHNVLRDIYKTIHKEN